MQEEEDGTSLVVFGCYTAVALADPRVLLALPALLGAKLLYDRHWQKGAYTCEVSMGFIKEIYLIRLIDHMQITACRQTPQYKI